MITITEAEMMRDYAHVMFGKKLAFTLPSEEVRFWELKGDEE